MSEYVYAGLTSQTVDVFLQDSSSTTGGGLTSLVYNSSGLKCYYRKGATGTATAITLATQTVGGAWSSGGFVEVDATNMPGVYRLDLPNAAVDTAGFVTLYFYGATNLAQTPLRIDCRPLPVDVKQFGGTNGTFSSGRPDVNAAYIGGQAASLDTNNLPKVSVTDILNTALTETSAGYLAAAFKKLFDVATPVLTAASVNQTGDSYARVGAPVGASISADIASVKTDTGTTIPGKLPTALTANGNIKASFTELITTALTETSTGRLKGALTTFLDVASPVFTSASVNQTGDSYARIGTAGAGLTALGDTRIANLDNTVSSRLATSGYSAPLDAAGTRSAVGLATANLDTQLATIVTNESTINGNVTAVGSSVVALGSPMQAGSAVILSATQANYAPAKAGDAMALTTGERNSVADALLDRTSGVESGLTLRVWLRRAAAALFGKASGMNGTTATFRDTTDTKNRIVATVDSSGDRTSLTFDDT